MLKFHTFHPSLTILHITLICITLGASTLAHAGQWIQGRNEVFHHDEDQIEESSGRIINSYDFFPDYEAKPWIQPTIWYAVAEQQITEELSTVRTQIELASHQPEKQKEKWQPTRTEAITDQTELVHAIHGPSVTLENESAIQSVRHNKIEITKRESASLNQGRGRAQVSRKIKQRKSWEERFGRMYRGPETLRFHDLWLDVHQIENSSQYQGYGHPVGGQLVEPKHDDISKNHILNKPLTSVSLNIKPTSGTLPGNSSEATAGNHQYHISQLPGTVRGWQDAGYHWNAPLVTHLPLYYEEVNLERHGYTHGMLQPLISGAKFFATAPLLPYLMTADPVNDPEYDLGEYRPGTKAPYQYHYPPISLKGALVEASVITGFSFLIP